jgi:hypothetical protein
VTVPHDTAGNPLDLGFNSAVFTGSAAISARSIFTDKGPISKPALTLASGSGAVINGPDTITLTGASLNGTFLDRSLTISGGAVNGGTFRITAVLSATKVRVKASFSLPDAANGTLAWRIFDPRDGQIADDPADVTVRINGSPVTPLAVIGLLGQVVLASAPAPSDVVRVSYSWVPNPTVDIRRLNSREFRLNGWNRDVGYGIGPAPHAYRYNNVLVRPSEYVAADMQATLSQPLQRGLKYRAYERAYTPVLNDPNLLKLNSPIHRIASPPLSRTITPSFVSYAAVGLPEADAAAPWVRHGSGSAAIVSSTLIVSDTSAGPFPSGNPIFWSRPIDLTFDHVFAATWRMLISATPVTDGVFTGVAAGYADADRAVVVGYLNDGGVKKIGILKSGAGNDPSLITSWTGGLDGAGSALGVPVAFDWSVIHSYRLFCDRNLNIKIFIDGDVSEILRVNETECPYLEELDAPFDALEGTFFGSLARPATNTSNWDFFRYTILPTNPLQTAPSVFVSYEGTTPPETASQPWTPVGFAGSETIINATSLLLDSTSATITSSGAGLVGGDFKGFDRIEPLLAVSSDVVLDIDVQLRTHTHGITPNAVMAAIDDGSRLVQLCFFPDKAAPKLSYGGHSLPTTFVPTPWSTMGTQPAAMTGRLLRITDTSLTDGRIYFIDDNEPLTSTSRVVAPTTDYMLECRVRVLSHMADVSGFCGVTAEVYDGLRTVGLLLREVAGVRSVSLHSDGVILATFGFEWNDAKPHTYRIVKNTGGNLVSVFVDSALLGTVAYSAFAAPGAGSVGVVSFGSATSASMAAQSVVEWSYANAWRILSDLKRYAGLWRGADSDSLVGYHLPLKTSGKNAHVVGSAIGDGANDFLAAGVTVGDYLVIDAGTNKGSYEITAVAQHSLTTIPAFTSTPSVVDYRVPAETDWTTAHRYRVVRDPGGAVAVLLDSNPVPLIRVGYDEVNLPASTVGVPRVLSGALPSVCFGSFDPTNLAQSTWDYVRYGITRSPTEMRIAPHHPFLNQRNVIASPEHLYSNTPHSHTDFWSSSTGIPPQLEADFLKDPTLIAYTLLNEGTPLVPSTQTFEVRKPQVVSQPVSGLNRPEDILNSDRDFLLNDGATRLTLLVPDDVLYNSLQVIEAAAGEYSLIAPFNDEPPQIGTLYFQKEHCLKYDGTVLPELDTPTTPWVRASDDPSHVTASAFGGILTYGTDGVGTKTVYRNATPLPDSIGMTTQVKFRLKILQDSTSGTGDSQVRIGFSAPGMTLSLGFVTSPLGERYVLILDQNAGTVVGGRKFDFLDGNYHVYRLVRDSAGVSVFIDS